MEPWALFFRFLTQRPFSRPLYTCLTRGATRSSLRLTLGLLTKCMLSAVAPAPAGCIPLFPLGAQAEPRRKYRRKFRRRCWGQPQQSPSAYPQSARAGPGTCDGLSRHMDGLRPCPRRWPDARYRPAQNLDEGPWRRRARRLPADQNSPSKGKPERGGQDRRQAQSLPCGPGPKPGPESDRRLRIDPETRRASPPNERGRRAR